jgi:hypothetical protein
MSDASEKSMIPAVVKVAIGTMLLAVVFGVINETIMANTDVSYFTMYLPHLTYYKDPNIIGPAWGAMGSWWTGLIAGVLLGLAGQMGSAPRISVGETMKRLLKGLFAIFIVSLASLAILIRMSDGKVVPYQPDPSDTSGRFYAVMMSHNIVIGFSIAVVLFLCYRINSGRSKA